MQECPTSPLLWSLAIFMEAPQQRKGRSVDALKKAGEHPAVIIGVARLFWAERKIEKTRQWMANAVKADSDWGDAWGWWLKFERQHGEPVSCPFWFQIFMDFEADMFLGTTGRCHFSV